MASAEKTNEPTTNGITLAQILSKDGEPIEEEVLAEEMGDGPEENEETPQVAKEGFCVECEGNKMEKNDGIPMLIPCRPTGRSPVQRLQGRLLWGREFLRPVTRQIAQNASHSVLLRNREREHARRTRLPSCQSLHRNGPPQKTPKILKRTRKWKMRKRMKKLKMLQRLLKCPSRTNTFTDQRWPVPFFGINCLQYTVVHTTSTDIWGAQISQAARGRSHRVRVYGQD
jgi:hypothetical protein